MGSSKQSGTGTKVFYINWCFSVGFFNTTNVQSWFGSGGGGWNVSTLKTLVGTLSRSIDSFEHIKLRLIKHNYVDGVK